VYLEVVRRGTDALGEELQPETTHRVISATVSGAIEADPLNIFES
jgi:hypothetical protein